MAVKALVNLGVRTLKEEGQKPGNPPLLDPGWLVETEKYGDYTYFKISNPKKGVIEFIVVRAMLPDGSVRVWAQPVFTENPGAVLAPVRKIKAKKSEKDDQIIVYMVVIGRSIVEPRVNVDPSKLPTKKLIEVVEKSKIGIKSVEFARGIGPIGGNQGSYKVSTMWKSEKLMVLGNMQMFNATGAEDEMNEEMPEFKIHPGTKPMMVAALNPNTALFRTSPGAFIIPISPDIREKEIIKPRSEMANQELIESIIPFRHPSETDALLNYSEEMIQGGSWDPDKPICIDPWTMSMLAQIDRLNRAGRLPITG